MKKIHFSGIGGNGMSALAQLHAMSGDTITGSDRLLDKGYTSLPIWDKLTQLGVKFTPQDGSGVTKDLDAVVLSTAIENDNPEVARAKEFGIKIIHRSELLASHVNGFKTVAISGTSGKSTTTAMLFEILRQAGKAPSVITGAPIVSLQEEGLLGNVYRGKSDLLVIEADESDGSLVNYKPALGVMLNLTRDHKELDVLFGYFRKFKPNCGKFITNADEDNLAEFAGNNSFGINKGTVRAENVKLDAFSTSFTVNGLKFNMSLIGRHNVENAIAAIAAALELGASLGDCAEALCTFKGVYRRFQSLGNANGVEVIDDFAHNPAKIAASLAAARLRGKRVLAVYQPHGYAPVKMLKNELIASFSAGLGEKDRIWFPEIYYVGGTADRSISSKDLSDAIAARGGNARFLACREEIIPEIMAAAQPGDVVLVMGARDPTLSNYAKTVLTALKTRQASASCQKCTLRAATKSL